MKKVYSIILLFTFIVGTLQPIIPMVEYQLFEGNLIELLAGEVCPSEESCDMIQCFPDVDCPSCDDNQKLLDIDYYPLALEITTIAEADVYLIGERIHLPNSGSVVGPVLHPQSPPPRMS